MRTEVLLLSMLTAGLCAGCGPSPKTSTVPASSSLHGGILIPLPEDQGYVELLNDKRERRGSTVLTTVVAYLLQPDQKTAMAVQAKSVTVKLGAPPSELTMALRSEPDRSDPVGSARFVSEPGSFYLNQSGGEIVVVLDGKTLTAPFRGPR